MFVFVLSVLERLTFAKFSLTVLALVEFTKHTALKRLTLDVATHIAHIFLLQVYFGTCFFITVAKC